MTDLLVLDTPEIALDPNMDPTQDPSCPPIYPAVAEDPNYESGTIE